jgi:hypothetical protein
MSDAFLGTPSALPAVSSCSNELLLSQQQHNMLQAQLAASAAEAASTLSLPASPSLLQYQLQRGGQLSHAASNSTITPSSVPEPAAMLQYQLQRLCLASAQEQVQPGQAVSMVSQIPAVLETAQCGSSGLLLLEHQFPAGTSGQLAAQGAVAVPLSAALAASAATAALQPVHATECLPLCTAAAALHGTGGLQLPLQPHLPVAADYCNGQLPSEGMLFGAPAAPELLLQQQQQLLSLQDWQAAMQQQQQQQQQQPVEVRSSPVTILAGPCAPQLPMACSSAVALW